jgi:hypothetical protein
MALIATGLSFDEFKFFCKFSLRFLFHVTNKTVNVHDFTKFTLHCCYKVG